MILLSILASRTKRRISNPLSYHSLSTQESKINVAFILKYRLLLTLDDPSLSIFRFNDLYLSIRLE